MAVRRAELAGKAGARDTEAALDVLVARHAAGPNACEACGHVGPLRNAVGAFVCEDPDECEARRCAPKAAPTPSADPDDVLAACMAQLDSVCTWLDEVGHDDAAKALHEERNRWLLPLAKVAVSADSSRAAAIEVGDVVAFVDRTPKFRIDALATRYGEPAAEMTMIVNDRGETVSYKQLGGPASLKNAVVTQKGGVT